MQKNACESKQMAQLLKIGADGFCSNSYFFNLCLVVCHNTVLEKVWPDHISWNSWPFSWWARKTFVKNNIFVHIIHVIKDQRQVARIQPGYSDLRQEYDLQTDNGLIEFYRAVIKRRDESND